MINIYNMKYIKKFESLSPNIGDQVTFVALYYRGGNGLGFSLIVRDLNAKFVQSIDCREGAEINGELVSLPDYSKVAPFWRIKLKDNTYADLFTDKFKLK